MTGDSPKHVTWYSGKRIASLSKENAKSEGSLRYSRFATPPNGTDVHMPKPRYVFAIIAVGALVTTAVLVAVQISIVHQVKSTPPHLKMN